MKQLERALEELRNAHRVLIASHVNPDLDTIGSQLALKLALEKAGKQVTTFNTSGANPTMDFMPGVEAITAKLDRRHRYDVTVTLDAGTSDRFGQVMDLPKEKLGTIIKIDHHITQNEFADINYIDDKRASCAELVADVIEAYPIPFDEKIAINIYAAIVSDTGGFRYSNTNQNAFGCAGKMLAYGISPWYVSTMLYENRPEAEIRLLAEALGTLDISSCGMYATITITYEMMQRTGAEAYMLDGFVNFARSIQGVEVALLVSQRKPGNDFRVSFRSKGKVNVAAIAKKLGGGGHHNAAGCSISGEPEDVKERLWQMVDRTLPRKSMARAKG